MPYVDPKIVIEGDVIEGDNSWMIGSISKDYTVLTIGQNFKNVAEPGGDVEPIYEIDMEGPVTLNGVYSGGELDGKTYLDVVEEKGLSVRGKNFLVVRTDSKGGGYDAMDRSRTPYPDGHHVTALELTPENEIKTGGLRVEFYQTGCFVQDCMVQQPKVIGRMEPVFSEFKAV